MIGMLSYEVFKNKLVASIKDYLPIKYRNYSVELHTINKINTIQDGLCVVDKSKPIATAPVIYVDMMYAYYVRCGSLAETMKMAAESIVQGFYYTSVNQNVELSKDNIVLVLINYEKNKKLLETVPHVKFLDLAYVFRWIVKIDDDGISGSLVTNEIARAFELDTDELFELAKQNTKRLLPPKVAKLSDMLNKLIPEEFHSGFNAMPVYILTNEAAVEGAASIVYTDILEQLRQQFNDNLILIPSSINEWLVLPRSFAPNGNISDMVHEVNLTAVAENERLSDNVYLYDGTIKQL
jgi:hypothetical protein